MILAVVWLIQAGTWPSFVIYNLPEEKYIYLITSNNIQDLPAVRGLDWSIKYHKTSCHCLQVTGEAAPWWKELELLEEHQVQVQVQVEVQQVQVEVQWHPHLEQVVGGFHLRFVVRQPASVEPLPWAWDAPRPALEPEPIWDCILVLWSPSLAHDYRCFHRWAELSHPRILGTIPVGSWRIMTSSHGEVQMDNSLTK